MLLTKISPIPLCQIVIDIVLFLYIIFQWRALSTDWYRTNQSKVCCWQERRPGYDMVVPTDPRIGGACLAERNVYVYCVHCRPRRYSSDRSRKICTRDVGFCHVVVVGGCGTRSWLKYLINLPMVLRDASPAWNKYFVGSHISVGPNIIVHLWMHINAGQLWGYLTAMIVFSIKSLIIA